MERLELGDGEGQTIAEARGIACDFIRSNLAIYNKYKDSRDPYSIDRAIAYEALGQALHLVMDYTSPVHGPWDVWYVADRYKHGGDLWYMDNPSREDLRHLTKYDLRRTHDLIKRILGGEQCECVLK